MNAAPAPATVPDTSTQRPGILAVQGCSGCNRPRRVRVNTPVGMRLVYTRLTMTRIPLVFAEEARHPRSAPVTRRYPVYAPLCKTCRQTAIAPAAGVE